MASFSHAERDAATFRRFSARVVSAFAANPPAFCLENDEEPCYRPVKPSITAEFKRTLAGRSAAELPRMVRTSPPNGCNPPPGGPRLQVAASTRLASRPVRPALIRPWLSLGWLWWWEQASPPSIQHAALMIRRKSVQPMPGGHQIRPQWCRQQIEWQEQCGRGLQQPPKLKQKASERLATICGSIDHQRLR